MSDTGTSPVPDGGGGGAAAPPSSMRVAISFVKMYYKALTSQPDQINGLYIPTKSYLSHGEGSAQVEPKLLEEYDLSKERWGCDKDGGTMRFDFEHGAIDAHPVGEGILVVVTAQVFLQGEGDDSSRAFVQTFFLAKEGRNFAVQSDVLRFLTFPSAGTASPSTPTASIATNTIAATTSDVGVETDRGVPKEEKKEEAAVVSSDEGDAGAVTPSVVPAEDDAPGGGVEESKEEAPEVEDVAVATEAPKTEPEVAEEAAKDPKKAKPPQQEQKQQPASKPVPGSWASLVASSGSAPNTPSRKPVQQAVKVEPVAETTKAPAATGEKDKAEKKETSEPTKEAASQGKSNAGKQSQAQPRKQYQRGDPDNTLVIKNLGDNVKESDIVNMFKPFATQTNAKIVGSNLNIHRGLAFIDYDSDAPVLAALKKHTETPFQWNGKILEIDQKSQENRGRRTTTNGGGHRSSGGGGGGGRDQYRRDRDRGARRSGNRGSGGGVAAAVEEEAVVEEHDR